MRESDYRYPNPPDDMPYGPYMIHWPRKPTGGKPKYGNKVTQRTKFKSKSGLHKLMTRASHGDPFF
jgi:hypothetical protein